MAKVRRPLPLTVDWQGPNRREHYLDSLVKQHGWLIGAEIGVRVGRTLFHLLDHNPQLKMYAVDKDIGQFYNTAVQKKYGARLCVLDGISWEKSADVQEAVDFVFIDAAHSRKNVIRDITAWAPKLRTPKGLTGHDIDFPAVQQALQELQIKFDVGPDNVWTQKCT